MLAAIEEIGGADRCAAADARRHPRPQGRARAARRAARRRGRGSSCSAAIYAAVDTALAELQTSRAGRGRASAATSSAAEVDEIARLRELAAAHPGRGRDAILARLKEQIADLMASGAGLSEDRLAQEALLLATKADIREELDRLRRPRRLRPGAADRGRAGRPQARFPVTGI